MIFVIAIVAGILPMVIYPFFLYLLDRYEKEPVPLLVAAFLWGFVPAAILSLISQVVLQVPLYVFDDTGALAEFAGGIVYAPVTEEFFKGIAVFLIVTLFKKEFDGLFDGIIYGSLVGFGFAAIENILYFLSFGEDGLVGLVITRAFIFGLNHAFYTSLTGIGFGIAYQTRNRFLRPVLPGLGLFAAIMVHSIHNSTVTFAEAAPALLCVNFFFNFGGIFLVFLTMLLAVRRERVWITTQLAEEVGALTLSPGQYDIVSSPTLRYTARLGVLFQRGLSSWRQVGKYYQLVTKLAFLKHRYTVLGEEGATLNDIEDLRAKSREMSKQIAPIMG